MILLAFSIFAACSEPPVEAVPDPIRPNLDEIAAEARSALDEQGISHLTWAITPFRGEGEDRNPYTALIEAVADRLDIEIHQEVGSNYEDLERRIESGEVDLGVLGPYSYVRTQSSSPEIRVFASHISRGNITYGSYIISREDGPVDTIEDLVGRRIAYVDPSSASGWLFPAARLLEAGIHPTEDLDSEFYGNHERVVHAVMEGEVDAGATYSDVLLDHIREGNDAIRVVAKGALVPHDAYVLRPGLPTIIGEAVGLAMSEISTRDPIGREILGDLRPINGFVPVDDDHYERVRYVNERVRSNLGEEP